MVALNLALIVVVVSIVFMLDKEKDSIKQLEAQQVSLQEEQRRQQESLAVAESKTETQTETQSQEAVTEVAKEPATGNFVSDWNGLKAAWYGDSLTELYYHCQIVDEYFGFEGYNCGISGTAVTYTSENAMCLEARMTSGAKPIPADVDVIFVMAGTNDWCGSAPLGEKTLTYDVEGHLAVDNTTFYGACHQMFHNMTSLYPNAYIIVMGTPFGASNQYNVYNSLGLTSLDYGDALCEAASMWGIPSFNIGEMMGINVNNVTDEYALMYEGIHFVEGGARMAADVIIQEVSKMKYYK